MDRDLQPMLAGKRAHRRKLMTLPPAEKLRLQEELMMRGQVQRGSRRTGAGTAALASATSRFGGRATAGGVNYEVRIAALLAVKMLAGDRSVVWNGISGADVAAITMQAPEPVDDIVVSLHGDDGAGVYLSAKDRGGTVALTGKSPAFAETVTAFVRQYLQLAPLARARSRLVWAVPTSAGPAATRTLPEVLEAHRRDAGDVPFSEFLAGRQTTARKALKALWELAAAAWAEATGAPPVEEPLREFLRAVHVEVYDSGGSQGLERLAEGDLRAHIAATPSQAPRMWTALESFFTDADQRGLRVTPGSLRRALSAGGFALAAEPDYAHDVAFLRRLTARNVSSLKEHAALRFGPNEPADVVHIPRTAELNALLAAARSGHLLLTGEPGCGKSGLLHSLAEALQAEGRPVALLLAEELAGHGASGATQLPGLTHPLNEVIAHWPDGGGGVFITDALDAVRDTEVQRGLRQMLRDLRDGPSGWTVLASVREFDLKYGRELRETFPGNGVAGHAARDFADVAHFHLTGLSDGQLDDLVARRQEIGPFVRRAREVAGSGQMVSSPFYLRLAAELLRGGAPPERVADWNSPAVLLRRFWEARVEEGAGADGREIALREICRRMVDARSTTLSAKETPLGVLERMALRELRSGGVLQGPTLRHGSRVGDEEIRFSHHLLHDYAIARVLIPTTQERFSAFMAAEPLLSVFYRQSFYFALEELWDWSEQRTEFWGAALQMEGATVLHGITRILAPVLAARRVSSPDDLRPLLTAVTSSVHPDAPALKALGHLAAGLQDANEIAIRAGADGWCSFVQALGELLPTKADLETPLVHLLARLNEVGAAITPAHRLALNAAARRVLAHHVAKEVKRGWRYAGWIASEVICRTFEEAPAGSEAALLALLTPERLAHFPHNDLFDLAHRIKYLGEKGNEVIRRLYEAAFTIEPEPGQWENETGSLIMSMRMQTSDQWHSVRYSLGGDYAARKNADPALMTEIACLTWNGGVHKRQDRRGRQEHRLATIRFRGVKCPLLEDHSHIWGREAGSDEGRILSRFEELLREWAADADTVRLDAALDRFAACNRTSLLWNVLMEIGAEHPDTLGVRLQALLHESVLLTHPDYAYGAATLLGALHHAGDAARRTKLEELVLELPNCARLRKGGRRQPTPSWLEYAQNRLLAALQSTEIQSDPLRELWQLRQAVKELASARERPNFEVTSHTLTNEEILQGRGIDLKDPANEEMFRLREALKPLMNQNGRKLDARAAGRHWPVVARCEEALRRHAKTHPEMAEELWGHLVGACANLAAHARWPRTSPRWLTIRRVLLKASRDPVPEVSTSREERDQWPSWGWPSPRIDAACGLPLLACRLGRVDNAMAGALRRLCRDGSHPLRFNLADRLAVLWKLSPTLTWELVNTVISQEQMFSVLEALLLSLNRLRGGKAEQQVAQRLEIVTARVMDAAPADHHIHESLAHTHLFSFLRTGDPTGETFISRLISECDAPRAIKALLPQLHACRAGGWMTAGDGITPAAHTDTVRGRTWTFLSKLLTSAQEKLDRHRAALRQLHADGPPAEEVSQPVRARLENAAHIVDGIAAQLYFASGAFDEKRNGNVESLSVAQTRRFWQEAAPLLGALATEIHPHTAHQVVQTLDHLLPCAPAEVFLLAARSIQSSSEAADYHRDSLAVPDVVKLVQRALADHRDIFRAQNGQANPCLRALLGVLDRFVDAGWAEARQLTHRLEEIYR